MIIPDISKVCYIGLVSMNLDQSERPPWVTGMHGEWIGHLKITFFLLGWWDRKNPFNGLFTQRNPGYSWKSEIFHEGFPDCPKSRCFMIFPHDFPNFHEAFPRFLLPSARCIGPRLGDRRLPGAHSGGPAVARREHWKLLEKVAVKPTGWGPPDMFVGL